MPRAPFVGRESELAQLSQLFDEGVVRAVAIVGPVGIGKTRFAEEWSRGLAEGDGRWDVRTCTLEETGDEALLWALAEAAGVGVRDDVEEAVGRELAGASGRVWLIDHAERLDGQSEDRLRAWCDHLPDTRFLLLSRRELPWVDRSIRLDPLRLPSGDEDGDAYALFVEHALRLDPTMVVDERSRAAVREIVGSLDGLPLAITLAAPRLRLMSIAELRSHLEGRSGMFEMLDPTPRERDLRLELDALWHELSPPERALLTQLSVFRGPFDLAAARATVELDDKSSVVSLMTSLSERCLLEPAHEPGPGSRRLRLLRPIAAHAASKLGVEQKAQLEKRYAAYLVESAEAAVRGLTGEKSPWHARWLEQHANALGALFADDAYAALHARLVIPVDEALARRGYWSRRLQALRSAHERGLFQDADEPSRWSYWTRRAETCWRLGDYDASSAALEQAALAPVSGDPHLARARLAILRSRILFAMGRIDEARAAADEGIERAAARNDAVLEAEARFQLSKYYQAAHQPAKVIAEAERMLELYRGSDHLAGRNAARRVMGTGMIIAGRAADSVPVLHEALEEARAIGDEHAAASSQLNIALAQALIGAPEVDETFEEARRALRQHGAAFSVCLHEINWAYSRLARGEIEDTRARLASLERRIEHLAHPYLDAYAGILSGWILLLEGDTEAAARATDGLGERTRATRVVVATYRAFLVAAMAYVRLDRARASALLDEARLSMPGGPDQYAPLTRVVEAAIELAAASELPAPTDEGLTRLAAALDALVKSHDAISDAQIALHEPSFLKRAAADLASSVARHRGGDGGLLVVGPAGSWARHASTVAELSTRRSMSAILAALTEAALAGELCSQDTLIEAAWPGQKLVGKSATSRLQVAISSLRKAGLRDVIVTEDGRYGLRADLELLALRGREGPDPQGR